MKKLSGSWLLVAFGFTFGLGACGESSTSTTIDAAIEGGGGDRNASPDIVQGGPDAPLDAMSPPDMSPPEAAPMPVIGAPCTGPAQCPMPGSCINSQGFPSQGYCTVGCLDDSPCGSTAFCQPNVATDMAGNPIGICLLKCGASDTCMASAHVCSSKLAGVIPTVQRHCNYGTPGTKEGAACTTFGNCAGNQACVNSPYDFPGGHCTTLNCTVGDNATCAPGGDGVCIAATLGNFNSICRDACTADADCRAGYTCLQPATGRPRVCGIVTKEPGSACTMDTECGPSPWTCSTTAEYPGGYCGANCTPSGPGNLCPIGSICNGATCLKTCTADTECRMSAGYRCVPLVLPAPATSTLKVCQVPPPAP